MNEDVKYSRPVKKVLITCIVVSTILLLVRVTRPPTSYLHSWNQVTTLATIQGVGNRETSLLQPKEVTSRVTWPGSADLNLEWADDARFTVYEEFPLYHGLCALLVRAGIEPEISARLISIPLWAYSGIFLFLLARAVFGVLSGCIAAMLFLTSFPILYYGQAIMSDVGMLAFLTSFVFALHCHQESKGRVRLFWAPISLAIAALFKSYAAVFAPVILCSASKDLKDKTAFSRITPLFLMVCAVLPVVVWHVYAALQPGYNESLSHSWRLKQEMLLNSELYGCLIKSWFRYLGDIPGSMALLSAVVLTAKGIPILPNRLPAWVLPYTCCFVLYLLFTADKLPYHDYYFLPGVPLIVPLGGALLAQGWMLLQPKAGRIVCGMLFLLFIVHYGLSIRSYLKATRPNPDVMNCADAVKQRVPKGAMIATLSDVVRYNSIQYYSGRRGVTVEHDAFPLERYRSAGAAYLVVNLGLEDKQRLADWLRAETAKAKMVTKLSGLVDAKGRPRSCDIYAIQSR